MGYHSRRNHWTESVRTHRMPASNAIIKKPDFSQSAQSSARNKPLPQNIEAEESVLAACMLNGEAVEELILKLKPEYFFRPAHRIIFEAVCDLNIRRIPVDQISLADTLNASGQLEAVGGKAYLVDLADNTFALTNWQNHAEIVKRTAILRELDLCRRADQRARLRRARRPEPGGGGS